MFFKIAPGKKRGNFLPRHFLPSPPPPPPPPSPPTSRAGGRRGTRAPAPAWAVCSAKQGKLREMTSKEREKKE